MMIGLYPRCPDRIDGGVESAVTYLSQALAAEPGLDLIGVRIVADESGSRHNRPFGWPIHDLALGSLSLSTLYRRQKRRLRSLIDQFRPDIVHGQGVDLAGFLAVGCGLPSVVTVHGILGEDAKYQTNLKARARAKMVGMLIERQTVRRARELISISPYVTQYYGRTIKARVHEIPNAIAPRFFDVERAPERGRLLFAGRIIKRKGVLDLVRAIARNRRGSTRLVIAGSAPDRGYEDLVRQDVERLGLAECVEFVGLLDEPALLRQFARAEALVLPSYQETAPMVIQQAMASGIAVIASSICGIPYQIHHGVTGLLFEAGNVDQLAGQLGRLCDEPSLSSRLGEAAKADAGARYHACTVGRATRSAYEDILGLERTHA